MKALKAYTIQFVGLKEGEHTFLYDIDKTFFDHFEYEDFNGANISVNLNFVKKATLMQLVFKIEGSVNVDCDVTNEPYDEFVEDDFKLIVKFGDEYNNDNEEILVIPHGEYELNVAHYIYELIVLSVPNKRVHPGVADGTLKSEILDKLNELSLSNDDKNKEEETDTDPRWDCLLYTSPSPRDGLLSRMPSSA